MKWNPQAILPKTQNMTDKNEKEITNVRSLLDIFAVVSEKRSLFIALWYIWICSGILEKDVNSRIYDTFLLNGYWSHYQRRLNIS